MGGVMVHQRIRQFNTRDTYSEQCLDNYLCVVRSQYLDSAKSIGLGDPAA